MKGIRYKGEFVGVDGTVWRAEILQRDYTGTVGELTFPYDEPISIAWEDHDKQEPVQGSYTTLKIESPGDRTYIDLYTLEAGYITLRIYRDDTLYWSGCLDPEFYEEPYERTDKYDVTLTFTDFGILDRIKWESREFVTLHEIVYTAISKAGIETADTSNGYRLMTTSSLDTRTTPLRLSDLTVTGSNFFDEDDEPRTLLEVLEAVLQPLALRIIQRAGRVYVYDINYLATHGADSEIDWSGSSSTLSADKVVNSCKVTFSPYDNAKVYDGSFDAKDVKDDGTAAIEYGVEDPWADEYVPGFRLYYGNEATSKPPYTIMSPCRLVRVESVYSGNDEAMVLVARKGNTKDNHGTASADKFYSAYPYRGLSKPTDASVAIRTEPSYIRQGLGEHKLKISVEALVDVRYNPYESAGKHNEEGNWSRLQNWSNFGYIPASLYLKDASGKILYHYDNRKMLVASDDPAPPILGMPVNIPFTPNCSYSADIGGWVKGTPARPDTFLLCWYSNGDRKSSSGFGGWQTNRQCIGYYRDTLPTLHTKRGEGEFIDMPPAPGFLELHIYDRIFQFDYSVEEKDIYSRLRWVALKEPMIEVVDKWGRDIDQEDIEYTGWINRYATEELNIGTEVGTKAEYSPAARGVLLYSTNLEQISRLTRAGVTDCAERLLIGTIYSQYSRRHTKLSGECYIIPDGLPVATEVNQRQGEIFMLAGETQDLRAGTSECTWVEALPDDWQGLEFEE